MNMEYDTDFDEGEYTYLFTKNELAICYKAM